MALSDEQRHRVENIIHRMRHDDESDWPSRLLVNMRDVYEKEGTELTERELVALRYSSHGLEPKEIADVMGISTFTVKEMHASARRRLRAKTTAHAVAEALRAKLIP